MSLSATEIEGHGAVLAERLIGVVWSGVEQPGSIDVAAHQFLWSRYMTTGAPRFGEAVLRSLSAVCRSAAVEHAGGGLGAGREASFRDDACLLELLTWVWRVERRAELRHRAESIVERIIADLRVPGFGFAPSVDAAHRPVDGSIGANGLMLVALVEAGSVFEHRAWLALAREIFDEIAVETHEAGTTRSAGRACMPWNLDDRVLMSRAAIRLFEAFGKQRHLDHALAWMSEIEPPNDRESIEGALSSHRHAASIGVLARLHALTGATRHAERANELIDILRPVFTGAGIDGAAAMENAQTAVRLLSITVSGDPRLAETRELMRIALDCGLPDRLVLGPGAGRAEGERPLVRVRVGAHRLAPIDDASRLRAMLAPGGLAAAFPSHEPCKTVDSRRMHGVT